MYYLPKTFIGRLLLICIIVSVLLGYSYHAIGSATDDAGVPMVVKQHIIDNNNYHGEEISLNFQDIPVRQVLQLIADVAGFNLITSDAVTGNVTLHLQNIPWDQALDLLLATHGLDKRQFDNVLMIAPAAEIAEQERQAAAANQQIAALAPLYTEHFRIRYANAQKLYELFTADNKASQQVAKVHLLSERGSIIVDERTNSLLITDTATRLAEFQDMVELLDVPVRQVLIEARIVIAKSNVDEQLGVRWGGVAVGSVDGNPLVASGTMDGLVVTENNLDPSIPLDLWPDRNGLPIDLGNSLGVNLGVNAPTGSFAVGYIGANVALNLELSALESRGQGEIVSQPKVITGDKQTAVIKSGTEVPYQQSSANGETTVAFKEAVLKLEVTPNITPDGRITMALVVNQDSVGELVPSGSGGFIPTIDTTELATQVLVGDSETVVLGGVFRTTDVISESRVPLLGDIPYFGRLFTKTAQSQEKSEILIFITPNILADTLVQS